MKCKLHVSPPWKNPAANGPWYQVESNPVIPVDNLTFTPAAKCTTATAAIRRATRVVRDGGWGVPSGSLGFSPDEVVAVRERLPGEKEDAAASEGPPHPPPTRSQRPDPTMATTARYGIGLKRSKLPSSSAIQSSSASAITEVARCAEMPSSPATNLRRTE